MELKSLFQPFECKSLKLKNRIVMAPMTRTFSPQGVPTAEVAAYYARRAQAEVGLIISEGTVVNRPAAANDPNIPHFHGEKALAGWKEVIDGVHRAGGKMAPQLWHVGIVNRYNSTWNPPHPFEGPSGLLNAETEGGVSMSTSDIEKTIAAFAQAAADAKALGFDCVEIHGAHGYLIDQFFWQAMNKRTDGYGGQTLKARSRFAVDVVRAIRAAVGEEMAIILRLSQWKQQDYQARLAETPQEMEEWLVPLAQAGVDIFHCSQRRFWEPEFAGSDLNFAGWAKKITGKATITVGSVGLNGDFIGAFRGQAAESHSLDEVLGRLERKEFDLVAVGRALLSDPQWAQKIHQGQFSQLKGFNKDDLKVLT